MAHGHGRTEGFGTSESGPVRQRINKAKGRRDAAPRPAAPRAAGLNQMAGAAKAP